MDVYGVLVFVLGLLVGAVNASTGIGWGIMTIPLLFMIPGIQPREAIAISLLAFVCNGVAASIENVRYGAINWKYAVWLAAGGVAGGLVGAWVLRSVPGATLERAVGVLVVLAGLWILASR